MCKKVYVIIAVVLFIMIVFMPRNQAYRVQFLFTPATCPKHNFIKDMPIYKYLDATCVSGARYYKTCELCGLKASYEEYKKVNPRFKVCFNK